VYFSFGTMIGLRTGRPMDRDSILGRSKEISTIQNLHIASAEVPVAPSLGLKRLEREAGPSPPSDAQHITA